MYYNYSIKPHEYEEANNIFASKHFDIKDLDYIVNQEDIYPLSYKDWKEICMFQKLDLKFVFDHYYRIDWDALSRNINLTEDIIEEFKDKLNWENISSWYPLTEEFVEEYKSYLDGFYIISNKSLTVNILKKIYHFIDWRQFSSSPFMTEEIIRAFPELINWSSILRQEPFYSEEFYREFIDYFDINELVHTTLGYQNFKNLLRELKDKIDWSVFTNHYNYAITSSFNEVYDYWWNKKRNKRERLKYKGIRE